MKKVVDKLFDTGNLEDGELLSLLSETENEYLFEKARQKRDEVYGKKVFLRGLIEVGNVCKNDCYYCGIRKSNKKADRYSLTIDEVMSSVISAREKGFSTFVLQGGETDNDAFIEKCIYNIKEKYPEVALTLSFGEKTYEIYKRFRDLGADRYLLRHETKGEEHYKLLHPDEIKLEKRIECLYMLKELGFQVGLGFMVGSPYQTDEDILKDLKFIKEFRPHMIGIGPFISHKDTPFSEFNNGSMEKTLNIISILRLMNEKALIPSTTALASISCDGRIKGINAGANVLMPNITPEKDREKYSLYDGKKSSGQEAIEGILEIEEAVKSTGCSIDWSRGDSLIKG